MVGDQIHSAFLCKGETERATNTRQVLFWARETNTTPIELLSPHRHRLYVPIHFRSCEIAYGPKTLFHSIVVVPKDPITKDQIKYPGERMPTSTTISTLKASTAARRRGCENDAETRSEDDGS
ncbi:hypothetical protein L596_025688 [Steinernema carpocapsae]|uniref:Uncharacterized protein n=1 Tax=Steinernema carpocapsae TaxID=34508 RepID=A0A4U5M8I7_STECR|nr:hypothetical protein L596_025688 [Steinernema carpocapsae]